MFQQNATAAAATAAASLVLGPWVHKTALINSAVPVSVSPFFLSVSVSAIQPQSPALWQCQMRPSRPFL